MVEFIHYQVNLLIYDVIKEPLVVVWKVMVQIYVNFVRKLDNLIVSCWVDKTRLKIVVEDSVRLEKLDF